MDNPIVTSIINKLHQYQITDCFNNYKEITIWINKLTPLEINNFLNININLNEIKFPKRLLINHHLLSCYDYEKRIIALSKLKNGEGCWPLFEKLCSPIFLNSNHYYQDLALISTAISAKYILRIIDNDEFINSKYHTEDLIMIIESQNKDINTNGLITELLAEVASNKASINSIYHRQDMDLIFKSDESSLQLFCSYHKNRLINLATNPTSLNDPYHIENMQILASNPLANEFLYRLMTDKNIISGKNYREEINALVEAKSLANAIAIYYYITNSQEYSYLDFTEFNLYDFDLSDESHQAVDFCYRYFGRKNNQPGNLNPDYLNHLTILNEFNDTLVPYFESVLSNKILINSQYYKQDIKLLQEIDNREIYQALHKLMTNSPSINSPYHFHDAILISQATNEKIRKLLLNKATNEQSLLSDNHKYDMNYISKLNLSKVKPHVYDCMHYYLFTHQGINSENHIAALEKLLKGEIYTPSNAEREYILTLQEDIAALNMEDELVKMSNYKTKVLTRIKKIFANKK